MYVNLKGSTEPNHTKLGQEVYHMIQLYQNVSPAL